MNIYELNDALRPIVNSSGANLSDDAFDDLVWQVAAIIGIDPTSETE